MNSDLDLEQLVRGNFRFQPKPLRLLTCCPKTFEFFSMPKGNSLCNLQKVEVRKLGDLALNLLGILSRVMEDGEIALSLYRLTLTDFISEL